jgi:tetratricopeptide (TPR) repeat protein
VAQVLAQADQNIARRFAGRPLIEASIRHALALAYEELGDHPKAEEHATRAVELRLAQLGPGHAETVAAQNVLGLALAVQSKVEGLMLLTRVLGIARKELGPEHTETLETLYNLAAFSGSPNTYDEAEALVQELLAIERRVLGPEHPKTLAAMHLLAHYRSRADRFNKGHGLDNLEKTKQLYEQILAVELRTRPNHPNTLGTMVELADTYACLQQFDRALDMRRRALDLSVRVMGLAHFSTQRAIGAYFRSAHSEGRHWEQARKELEQILNRLRRELGPQTRPTFCVTASCLALLLREHGRFAEARPLLEETLAEALRLRKELPKPDRSIVMARGLAQFLLGRWPGLIAGTSPGSRPPASCRIEAPFRAASPVADGRIAPGEYGPGMEAAFDDDANPGRLWAWGQSRSKTPDDLSVRVHASHTDHSLFLAFLVRDQFVDASEVDAKIPSNNDSVEVFINGDQVANDAIPKFLDNAETDNREGFQLVADAAGHQFTLGTAFTNMDWKAGTSRIADGYIIEFEIPLSLIDTRDGPDYVPAASGSELLVNFGINDNDAPVTAQTDYGIFWAEDPDLSLYHGGEEFWTVSLRLVPNPAGP